MYMRYANNIILFSATYITKSKLYSKYIQLSRFKIKCGTPVNWIIKHTGDIIERFEQR